MGGKRHGQSFLPGAADSRQRAGVGAGRRRAARIANTYAALNLGVWLVLAGLLWRLLAVSDWRSWLAWAGLLFSAGALHSVRLALPDLLGTTLLAAMMLLAERGRPGGALGALALAGLARETTLAAVVALWRGPWRAPRAWLRNVGRAALVALPLVLWLAYVRTKAGPLDSGAGNFSWPIIGWVEKGVAAVYDLFCLPDYFRWLGVTTLLAFGGLTVQAIYFLRRPEVRRCLVATGCVYVVPCCSGSALPCGKASRVPRRACCCR
jgi:hypothetical protein